MELFDEEWKENVRKGAPLADRMRPLTLDEFVQIVADEAVVRPPRWRLPYGVVLAAAAATELAAWLTRTEPLLPRAMVQATREGQLLDGTKARTELDLPQTPIEEAVRRALGWFKQQGMFGSATGDR